MACVSMAVSRGACVAPRSDASRRTRRGASTSTSVDVACTRVQASRRALLAGVAALTLPRPARALDLDDLTEIVSETNVDILRMADPRKMNPGEIELELELGRPTGGASTSVGVTPGSDDERDIVTTPSGLDYADIELGGGDEVKVGDLVVAHLIGTLTGGREFENTYKRGTALTFTLGVRPPGVSEGLEEAIGGMRAGGRRLVAIPPNLGFGTAGIKAPLGRVPGNAPLRYEIQLLRCLTSEQSVEVGFASDEKICCSDENYPCDPVRTMQGEEGEEGLP